MPTDLARRPALVAEVQPHEVGLMIKEIIYGRLGLSRGLLRRMKNGGAVHLNERPAYITERVQAGDRLSIFFADAKTELSPEDLGLTIVYEDEFLIVVNKPAGMAVHPTKSYPSGTLVNGLAYIWAQRSLASKVRLLHRLDRETSGLIVAAKEPYTYHELARQLSENRLQRTYLAIADGLIPDDQGVIDQPIGRPKQAPGHALQRAVVPDGKRAVTFFRVVRRFCRRTLLELRLQTGRTHQIRVHLAWLGYPVTGDWVYSPRYQEGEHRQLLHAWRLAFCHPRRNKWLTLRAPIPADMIAVLRDEKRLMRDDTV